MACPFFYPVTKSERQVSHRVPLGELYSGECRAHLDRFLPEHTVLAGPCNTGYGRESCKYFPATAQADAVRFHVTSKTAKFINVQYIFERACWPLEHGLLVYSRANRAFAEANTDPILKQQAWAFLQSADVGLVASRRSGRSASAG